MSIKQQATKKKPGRVTKRLAKRRKKAVSANQARRLAARHIIARMFDNASVRDGGEMDVGVYNMRRKDVWLVFPESENKAMSLRASFVVVVCKRTGRVLYDGPTNDEG